AARAPRGGARPRRADRAPARSAPRGRADPLVVEHDPARTGGAARRLVRRTRGGEPPPSSSRRHAVEPADCIPSSGAANGAEAASGAAAERHGIDEVNSTFDGHNDARRRGIRVLNHEELAHGDVSLSYVSKLMHRTYPDTPLFKKVLQTIYYQV